jgi:hypothetical protein
VMTPIQAARISVTAYPIIQVDMLAVIKCVPALCPVSDHVCHLDHQTLPLSPTHMIESISVWRY